MHGDTTMVAANKGFQDKMFRLYTGASLKQVITQACAVCIYADLPKRECFCRRARPNSWPCLRAISAPRPCPPQMGGSRGASLDLGGSHGVDRYGEDPKTVTAELPPTPMDASSPPARARAQLCFFCSRLRDRVIAGVYPVRAKAFRGVQLATLLVHARACAVNTHDWPCHQSGIPRGGAVIDV